jgi:branched-chain amino acid transport system substrate-binding protein
MSRRRAAVKSAVSVMAAVAAILTASDRTRAVAETPPGSPITIGFSMPLTGGLAVNGTSGLLAMQIWAEDTNKKGGLLGRPVKLDYYDDQTNPSLVPGIYTKLLDVDKVDLVVSAYGTNVTAPALPVVMQHNKTFMGLFAMDVNEEFRYPKYFSMLPVGPDPRAAISEGFFEIIKANKDKLGLKTIALAVDDGEATRNTADGARVNIKRPASMSFMTRHIPRRRRILVRSSARSRQPTPISSISPPIRRTVSA